MKKCQSVPYQVIKLSDSPQNLIAIKVNPAASVNDFSEVMRILSLDNPRYDAVEKAWLVSRRGYEQLKNKFEPETAPASVTAGNKEKKIIERPAGKKESQAVSSVLSLKAGSKAVKGFEEMGGGMKLQPYRYQKEIIKFCKDNNQALVIAPCGAGKTPCGIGIFLEAFRAGRIKPPGLIVVKASLKRQWEAEVTKFSNLRPRIIQTFKKLKSDSKAFAAQFRGAELLILNYETFNDDRVRSCLHEINPGFVFLDEIQQIKNCRAKRSRHVCEFNTALMRFGATATPVQKDPRDIFGIFKFLQPQLFPNEGGFWSQYLWFNQFGQPAGAKNTKELNEKISPYVIIKTKQEVSSQLPALVVSQRRCQLDPQVQGMSDRLIDEIDSLHEQEKQYVNRFSSPEEAAKTEEFKKLETAIQMRQTFAQEITDSTKLLGMSDSYAAARYVPVKKHEDTKIVALLELIKEIVESGEKVAVFSKYRKMQPIITEAVRKDKELKDVGIAYVNGTLSADERYEEIYNKFSKLDNYKILLLSDAGAEGINLGAAQYLIEVDLADSYAIQTQRHGRIERASSNYDTVYVYQLIAENSWDEIQLKVVNKKQKYDSEIVHGKASE